MAFIALRFGTRGRWQPSGWDGGGGKSGSICSHNQSGIRQRSSQLTRPIADLLIEWHHARPVRRFDVVYITPIGLGPKSIYKAEYLIDLNESACCGCGACVAMCSFGALRMDRTLDRPAIDLDRCYGCGVCRHACSTGALFLAPRDHFPALAGKY
jgi:ferredoxin